MPRRVISKLRKWVAGKRAIVVLAAGFGLAWLGLSLFGTTMIYTSTEAFCATSCHEMANNSNMEYIGSSHDKNRTGVRATCVDCHVPHAPIPLYIAKMGALNDLWSHHVTHTVDTPREVRGPASQDGAARLDLHEGKRLARVPALPHSGEHGPRQAVRGRRGAP